MTENWHLYGCHYQLKHTSPYRLDPHIAHCWKCELFARTANFKDFYAICGHNWFIKTLWALES